MQRYARQINLPEIGIEGQKRLNKAVIAMVGAGGLGAAALPYLAASGIGNITIIDHDIVSVDNLHRQTIYRTDQVGKNKAVCAVEYLRAINPDIDVFSVTEKITPTNAIKHFTEGTPWHTAGNYDLILDGSDNFETKSLLNDISIAYKMPLITASVNGFAGQFGIFEGYQSDGACYRCLFPDFPLDARNCNEAGILGTSAGLAGMMQAHLTLCMILGLEEFKAGTFYTADFKTMRIAANKISKNPSCGYCAQSHDKKQFIKHKDTPMIEILPLETVISRNALIIDVRQPEELIADPLENPLITQKPLNIPLGELSSRLDDLPKDRLLAFVCAGNIRSVKAAHFLASQGFDKICVLDKFTI